MKEESQTQTSRCRSLESQTKSHLPPGIPVNEAEVSQSFAGAWSIRV
jgi:hypothetical protein